MIDNTYIKKKITRQGKIYTFLRFIGKRVLRSFLPVGRAQNLCLKFDPFDGAKPHPLGRGRKHHSGSTLSKPQPSDWGVEGLTLKGSF